MSVQPATSVDDDDGPEEGEIEDDDEELVHHESSPPISTTTTSSVDQFLSPARKTSYDRDIREFEIRRARTRRIPGELRITRTMGTTRGNDTYVETIPRARIKDRLRPGLTHGKENRRIHRERNRSITPTKKVYHKKDKHDHQDRQISARYSKQDKHEHNSSTHQHATPLQRTSSRSSIECEELSSSDSLSRRRLRHRRPQRDKRKLSSSSDTEPAPVKRKPHHSKCPLIKVLQDVAKETRLAIECGDGSCEESSLKKRLCNMGALSIPNEVTSDAGDKIISDHSDTPKVNEENVNTKSMSPEISDIVHIEDTADEVTVIGLSRKVEPEVVTLTDSEDNGSFEASILRLDFSEEEVNVDVSEHTTQNQNSIENVTTNNEQVKPVTRRATECDEEDIGHLRLLALQSKKNEQSPPEDEDDLQLRLAALKTAILKKHKARKKGAQQVPKDQIQKDAEAEQLSPVNDIPLPTSPGPIDEVIAPVDMELAETDDEADSRSSTPYSPTNPTESPAQEVPIQDLLPPPPPPDLPLEMYFPDMNTDMELSVATPSELLPPPLPHFFRDMLTCIHDTSVVTSELSPSFTQEPIPLSVMAEPSFQSPEVTIQSASSPSTLNDPIEMDIVYDKHENDSLDTEDMVQDVEVFVKPLSSNQMKKLSNVRPNLRPISLNGCSATTINQHIEDENQEALEEDAAPPVDLDSMIVLDEVYDISPSHESQSENVISICETEHVCNQSNVEDDEEALRQNLLLEITNKRESNGPVCVQDASSAHSGESNSKTESKISPKHMFKPTAAPRLKASDELIVQPTSSVTTKTTVKTSAETPARVVTNVPSKLSTESPVRAVAKMSSKPTVELTAKPSKPTLELTAKPSKPTVELTAKPIISKPAKTVASNAVSSFRPTNPIQKIATKPSVESSIKTSVGAKPGAQAFANSSPKSSKNRLVYSSSIDKNLQVIVPMTISQQPVHKLSSTRINSNVIQTPHISPQDQRLIINLGNDSDSSDDYSEAEALGQRCAQNKEAWNRITQDYEQNAAKPSVPPQKGVKALTRNSATIKKTSLPPTSPSSLEDSSVHSGSKDIETIIDTFLKGVRSSHDAAIPPKVPSSSVSQKSSLSTTPMAVRNLPKPKQEEYKFLKTRIAEIERKMRLKTQSKTLKSSNSPSGLVQGKGLNKSSNSSSGLVQGKGLNSVKAAAPQTTLNILHPTSALSNSEQSRIKVPALQSNLIVREKPKVGTIQDKGNTKGGNGIPISPRVKQIPTVRHPEIASVPPLPVSNSRPDLKSKQSSGGVQTKELSKKCSFLSDTSVNLFSPGNERRPQEAASLSTDAAPICSLKLQEVEKVSAVQFSVGPAQIQNSGIQSSGSIKVSSTLPPPPLDKTAQSVRQLGNLEGELLSERSDVLEELSHMVALLAQVDTALEAQSRTANEVSTLVDQLRLSSGRLRAQNRMVTEMVGRVAQRQKDLSQGHRRFISVFKKCSEQGKQLHGRTYKVPSEGAIEMRAQLRLVHEQTQSLAHRRAQEQEKKKHIWERVEECLSKILQTENTSPKKATPNVGKKSEPSSSALCLAPILNSVHCNIADESQLSAAKSNSARVSVPSPRKGSFLKNSSKSVIKGKSIRLNQNKGVPSNLNPELVSKILTYRFAQKKLRCAKFLLNASRFKRKEWNGTLRKKRRSIRNVHGGHNDKRKESSDMEISTDGEESELRDCQVVDMSVSPDSCSSPASVSHNSTKEGESQGEEPCSYKSSHPFSEEPSQEVEGVPSSQRTPNMCLSANDHGARNFKLLPDNEDTNCGILIPQMLYCAVDELPQLPKNVNVHPSSDKKCVLKDYISPLGGFSCVKNTTSSSKDDPHAFLCPYDLNGKCKDTDCLFKHQL